MYEILVESSRTLVQLPIHWPLLLPSFQVLQPLLLHKVWNFGKYYPSYTWQKKYENLVEPSRASQARFSYFFSLLVKICQIFILFQSPGQNLPDCHTFSIFSKFGRLVLVDWAQLKTFQNLILKCLIPSEPEQAVEARRAVVANFYRDW